MLPVREARISGVTPVSDAEFGFAPRPRRRSTSAAWPFSAARARGVIDARAGGQQHTGDGRVAVIRGPVQCGGAVAFRGAGVDALPQQRANRRHVIPLRGLHQRLITSRDDAPAEDQ
jgi:hypothetical protein